MRGRKKFTDEYIKKQQAKMTDEEKKSGKKISVPKNAHKEEF